jgi:Fibrobacter succinogenes major domain (Fib_succ_major).
MHTKFGLFVMILTFAACNVIGQTVSLAGSVTDSVGNPLPGAIVSLKIAGLKDTTDTLGKFTLTNLSTGKFGSGGQTLPILYSQPLMKSGTLYFSTNQTTKAIIEIFTLKGQKVGNSVIQTLSQGNFNFPVGNLFPQKIANGFYAIRLTLCNNSFTFKINPMNITRQSGSIGKSFGTQGLNMAKITAIVDTLIVKKPCYYGYSMPIGSLSGSLPTIVLKSDGTVIPKTTIPLDSAMIEKIANITDTLDSIMTFNIDSLSNYHLTLDTSNVLVFPSTSKSPLGLLRKIIATSQSGKILTLYTRQASLAEAITKGHFDTTVTLHFPDSISLKKRALNAPPIFLTYKQPFSQDLITAGTEKVTVDGFISTSGTLHLSGDINYHKVNSIVFTGTITNTASLTITSTLDNTLEKKIKVGSLPLGAVVIDMGLLFYIEPVIDFYIGASGNITSSTSANMTYSNTFTSGITYQNNQWTTQNSSSQNFIATPPTLPQTTASLKAYAEADAICRIDFAIGPEITASGSLELDASIPGNPWWSLNTGLDIGAGINVSVLDITLLDKTFDIYNQSWPLLESAPINFKGTSGDSKINLTWDAYTGADSFFIYMSTLNTVSTKNYTQKLKTTAQSLEIDNLVNGQIYYFILTAHIPVSKIESFATTPISVTPTSQVITLTDIDGNIYHTVQIGSQRWTVENFRATRFNDGSAIPLPTDSASWVNNNNLTPGFCYYNNTTNLDTIKKFGALYNWYAVSSPTFAPVGWHVPSHDEWDTLQLFLWSNMKTLASTTDWDSCYALPGSPEDCALSGDIGFNKASNNSTGFTALPTGTRGFGFDDYFGGFGGFGVLCRWWSSTPYGSSIDDFCLMYYYGVYHYNGNTWPKCGESVRLVKNN